jgi:ureidoacrylate peracid hydrolase
MKQDMEEETREARNLSRREVIGLIGATAAASLVGAGEQPASAQQTSAPTHNTKSRMVEFDAKPEPIAIDTAKTAVIVVDMQNDFGTKGGMLDMGGIDISGIQKTIDPTATVLASARQAGLKIIYLKMGFHPDLSDLGSEGSPNRVHHLRSGVGKSIHAPDGRESRILIRDTWNTDIVPKLKPQTDDFVIYKHRFSGFYQTELDAILKQLGAKYLIITGCTTSICVESTIRDAFFRDYSCVLLRDCTDEPTGHGFPRSNYEATLFLVQGGFGWVSASYEFTKALKAQPIAAAQTQRQEIA